MSQTESQQGRWTVETEDGETLVTFQTFIDLDFKSETKAPEQPTEEGGFFTYNKVSTPATVYVTLAMQGKDEELGDAVDALQKAEKEATLLVVVTPSTVFTPVTLVGMSMRRRREDGINVLVVEMELKEVRQVAAQYSEAKMPRKQCKNPSDASKQDGGKVQSKSLLLQGKQKWWS